MKISQRQFIEGLKVPRKLQFGNIEHIELRNRIAYRKKIREEGVDCWQCGEKMVYAGRKGNILHWQCSCGERIETDRDGDTEFLC
jgi:tRNA(Ile2) C34 agmatinyltransferase TiaS